MSGHGNSEEYRSWRAVVQDEDGEPYVSQTNKELLAKLFGEPEKLFMKDVSVKV